MHRRRRIALFVCSAALLAAAPLLTGCGTAAHPGAAAVVDGKRITVSQLQGRVNEVRDALHAAVPNDAQYQQVVAKTGSLTRDTLQMMVLDQVVHKAASDAGVPASHVAIQARRSDLAGQVGGTEGLERAYLQQYGIAPAHIDESIRTSIEVQDLASRLGVDMNTPDGQNAFFAHLARTAKAMKIDLNPRYGTWDLRRSSRADVRLPWLHEVSAGVQSPA